MDMGFGGLRGLVMARKGWRAVVHGVLKSQTPLSDWTELNWILSMNLFPLLELSIELKFRMLTARTNILLCSWKEM